MHDNLSVNWSFLLVRWKRIGAGILAGLILAGLGYAFVTPLWESTALIQIGEAGNIVGSGESLPSQYAEIAAMKMMRPSFIKAAVQRVGHPEMTQSLLPRKFDGGGHMTVRNLKAGVIMVTIYAPGQILAKELTEGVAAEIIGEDRQSAHTHIIGDVEVIDHPVFPQPVQFTMLGLVLGGAIASLLVWGIKGQG